MPRHTPFTKETAAEYGRKGAAALKRNRELLAAKAALAPPDYIQVLTEHLKRVDDVIRHCVAAKTLVSLTQARANLQDQLLQLQNPVQDKPRRTKQGPTEPRPEAKPVGYTTTGSVQGNLE